VPDGPQTDEEPATGERLTRTRWSVGLAAFVIGMNVTMMNVAVADLRASFPDARFTTIGWVVSAYTIVFGAVLVPAGRLADRIGRRTVYMAGLAAFATGSVIAGCSPVLWLLVIGRVAQGVGAACLAPSAMALLLDATPARERAAATSFYAGAAALGTASGPSLGALLIDASSWRAAFFLGLPVVLVAYLLGQRSLPRSAPLRGGALPDLLGSVLVMAAVVGVSFGIGQGRPWGWTHPGVVGGFVAAAVLVPLFVQRCRTHPSPVMAVGLFRQRSFAGANGAALMVGTAIGGASLAGVLFLRDVWGYSLVGAGFGALPASLAAIAVARPVGRLGVRFGEVAVGVPGATGIALSVLWYRALVDADANYWLGYFPGNLLMGVGVAAVLPMLATAVVRGLGSDQFSLASATNRTFLQLGNGIGIAAVVAFIGATTGPEALADYRQAWLALGVVALVGAAAVAAIGRAREAEPVAAPSSTSPLPSPAPEPSA